MKTAKVAIEHVLAGLLALCAFVLPLLSGLGDDQKLPQSEALVGVLGIAYLFGIVFDKLADTVLSPIDKWLRLNMADDHLENSRTCFNGDPFPQDALEFSLRGDQDGRLEWMDSLRSRIRTSRGLAVLGLPAAVGIAIHQSFEKDHLVSLNWFGWPYSPVLINLLLIVGSIWLSSRRGFELPKTSDLCEDECKRNKQMIEARKKMLVGIFLYVVLLIACAVTVSTIAVTAHSKSAVIGIFGTVATLAGLWTWRSITKTYMKFVQQKLPELLGERGRQAS